MGEIMRLFNIFKKEEHLETITVRDDEIVAMADGKLIDVREVQDEMFAQKMLGDSVAFIYDQDIVTLCAPCNGELSVLYPTGHAFGLTMNNGVEILVHIGVNTVNANGKGFTLFSKKQGDRVKAGEPIVKVNIKELKKSYEMSTMLIITNANNQVIEFIKPQQVTKSQKIIE